MRIVAAGEHVVGAGEVDCELQCALIEVHRVVVELLQVRARFLLNIHAAVLERVEAAVEPLGEIRNRAAQMAERPANLRKPLGHAGEDERRRGERRVEEKPDERHQPVLLHHVDVDRMGGVNIENRAHVVRRFVDRPEALVAERDAVDVAEQHRPAQTELARSPPEFLQRRVRIVERQRRKRCEVPAARLDRFPELVVHHRRERRRVSRRLDVRSRRRQRHDLHRDAVLVQHVLPVREIAMSADGDVVVARIVKVRVAVFIDGDLDAALSRLQRLHVLRRIVMIVKVDHGHAHVSTGNRPEVRPPPGRGR